MKNSAAKKILAVIILAFLALTCVVAAPAGNSQEEIRFAETLGKALNEGSVQDALALFEKIPAALKDDVDMLSLKASLLLSAGKEAEAEAVALGLLEKEPSNVDVLALNAMIAKQRGSNSKKSQYLSQILKIEPFNADANIELASEQALKRNYRNARDYYKKALVKDPENEEALFGLGKMSYYMEKDDDAKNAFNKLLEKNPENPQALAYLAKFAAESRQYKTAIEYVNRALKSDPDNADHYFDLGTYSRYRGKYDDAEKYWKKAVELDPDYFLGYAYLAGLYDEQNKRDSAYTYYKKVIEKNPKYYYAYESIGMFAWDKGNWTEARDNFMAARRANPDNISYALMIIASWWKDKKPQEAKKYAASVMKGMDRTSLDYLMVRMFSELGGDSSVTIKVQEEKNRTKRGKFIYYLGLYWDIKGNDSLAQKYYGDVAQMEGAMFFESRLAQWKTGIVNTR